MELMESKSGVPSESDSQQSSILSGLPDDIAILFLARIPWKYHRNPKCVSKSWRELVCSQEWHSYRQKHNLAETWIYALCKDKFGRLSCYVLDPKMSVKGWKQIQGLPSRSMTRKGVGFEVLGKKIYLMGGCGWVTDATDEVYCYDAAINTWSEAPPLSTARCYFASEALGDKIYAIGGIGSKSSDPHSWDTFDSVTNCWTSHVDANVVPDVEDSVILDGKIYIRCGSSAVSSHVYAVVYEPSNGTWQHADADIVSGWRGPGVVVDGCFYVLDEKLQATRLMMWKNDSREWVAVGRLSPLLTKPPCRLVAIGTRIFVVGKGLSTVVFDVGNPGSLNGMLVSLSLPKLNSDEVISCKALAI